MSDMTEDLVTMAERASSELVRLRGLVDEKQRRVDQFRIGMHKAEAKVAELQAELDKLKAVTRTYRADPGLLAALSFFSRPDLMTATNSGYAFKYERIMPNGMRREELWWVTETMSRAFDVLSSGDFAVAKLMALKHAMHARGYDELYEMLMGEKLNPEKP